jgi:hypothetical protein
MNSARIIRRHARNLTAQGDAHLNNASHDSNLVTIIQISSPKLVTCNRPGRGLGCSAAVAILPHSEGVTQRVATPEPDQRYGQQPKSHVSYSCSIERRSAASVAQQLAVLAP